MKKLWTVLITLVILSLTLGTIACGGGAKELTGGDTSSSASGGGGTSNGGASGETCCTRDVVRVAVKMPPGEEYDLGRWLGDSMTIPHVKAKHNDCPLKLDFYNYKADTSQDELLHKADYLFLGEITVDEQTGYVPLRCEQSFYGEDCQGGEIVGRFTFKMQLVDNHRGKVLKEGQTSWTGTMFEGAGEKRPDEDEPYELGPIQTLSQSFGWLPEVIRKYERLPEKATLEPEKDLEKDPVQAGEKVTIHLKDIVDYKGNTAQPWEWVVVKAEKGQIVGGREQDDGTHAFEVGDGAIDFDYKAPDKCDKDTENKDTITVYNSCNNDVRVVTKLWPEKVIATKSFDIDCTGWLLEATYTYGESCSGGCCSGAYTYSLDLTADLKPEPDWTDYSLGQLYVADSAHVDLRFSNDVVQSCTSFCTEAPLKSSHQASYLGNLSLPVWLWTIPPSVSAGNLSRFERDYMWNPAAQNAGEAGQIWGMTPGTYTLNLDGFAYPLVSKAESLARDSLNLPPLKYSYSCDYEVCDVNTDYPCTNCRVETDAGSDYMPAFGEQSYLPAGLLVTMHDWFYEDPLHSPVQYSGNESVLKLDIARSSRDEDVRGLLFEFPGQLTSSSNCSGPLELGAFISSGGEFHSHIKWTLTRMEE